MNRYTRAKRARGRKRVLRFSTSTDSDANSDANEEQVIDLDKASTQDHETDISTATVSDATPVSY